MSIMPRTSPCARSFLGCFRVGSRIVRLFRRGLIALLLGIVLGLMWTRAHTKFPPLLTGQPTTQPIARAKPATFAHRVLDIESERADVPQSAYDLIDRMIASVRARVSTAVIVGDRKARERQVMHLLHTIDDVLVEQRFVFPLVYDSTLAEALQPRTVDRNTLFRILQRRENTHRREQIMMHPDRPVRFIACQQASLLYRGMAEPFDVDIRLVSLPHHVFMRVQVADDKWINWDPNDACTYSDEGYARAHDVTKDQIRDGVFLKTLSEDRVMSLIYHARACRCWELAKYDAAEEDYRRAIELDPQNGFPYAGLSCLYTGSPAGMKSEQHRVAESLSLAKTATSLAPQLPYATQALAAARAENGDFDGAIMAQQRAIVLCDEDDAAGRNAAGERLKFYSAHHTLQEGRRIEHPIVYWLGYQNGAEYLTWFIVGVTVLRVLIAIIGRIAGTRPSSRPPGTAVPVGNPAPSPVQFLP